RSGRGGAGRKNAWRSDWGGETYRQSDRAASRDAAPSEPAEGRPGALLQRLVVVELGFVVERGAVGGTGGVPVAQGFVDLADVELAPRPPLRQRVARPLDGDAVVAERLVPVLERLVGASGAVGRLGALHVLHAGTGQDGLECRDGLAVAPTVVEVLAEEERT